MKDFKKAKKEVEKYVEFFKELFFLKHWDIKIEYATGSKKNDDKTGDVMAELSHTSHEYYHTKLTIYPIFFKKTPDQQKSAICHELLHIITNIQDELIWLAISQEKFVTWREKDAAREKATSWMERIITNLLKQSNL